MAQSAKARNPKSRTAEPEPAAAGPNWPIFALAVAGLIVSGYLTYSALMLKQVAGCSVGSDCDVVLNSRWATLFGMPTSFWGFLTHALLAAVAWNKRTAGQWKTAWLISLFGVLYSLYLTGVSFYSLESACPYCLTSLALMSAIFIVVLMQRPASMAHFAWGGWILKSAAPAVVIILALHLHYAGYWGQTAGPEDPWVRGLAEHLSSIDAKFYGAYWCPHCTDQKKMFGSSVKRLPYVECSPSGPNGPVAKECKQARVESYPTWVINGQRYPGTQPLESLAQFSNFKSSGGK